MEELFAYSYLWAYGFCSSKDYNNHLDVKFLEAPTDELLLELEECSDNYKDTFSRLFKYFEDKINSLDSYVFGQTLFLGLKNSYDSCEYSISEFASKCYQIWKLLPDRINHDTPFYVLCYADDPLSWGDEKQTRELYEEAFGFYKK